MLATTALAAYAVQATAQNQMRTWTLPPNRVNFAPTGVAPLPQALSNKYVVSNGAYDANGNLLFYVRNTSVFRADGSSMGDLNFYSTSNTNCQYSVLHKEMAIVPVPGECKKFYIIYAGSNAGSCGVGVAVRYATVDLDLPAAQQFANMNAGGPGSAYVGHFTNNIAMAVGKVNSEGLRRLYIVSDNTVKVYQITNISNNPIAPEGSPTTYSAIPTTDRVVVAEISHDGTKLAWSLMAGGSNMAYCVNINPAGALVPINAAKISFPTGASFATGIEFGTNGHLYHSVSQSTDPKKNGIWKTNLPVNLPNNPSTNVPTPYSATQLLQTSEFNNSELELAYDGQFYAVNNSGKLVTATTATVTSSYEGTDLSIFPWSYVYQNSTTEKRTGSKSIKLSPADVWCTPIEYKMNAGDKITASVWVKKLLAADVSSFVLQFVDINNVSLQWNEIAGPAAAQTTFAEIKFTDLVAPAGTDHIRIQPRFQGTGTMYFDDISFTINAKLDNAYGTAAYASITVASNDNGANSEYHYSLPEQIDGENYANFRGIGTLIYPTPVVKSNGTVVTPASNIYTVYNCRSLTLAPTTSNYNNYTLTIFTSSATGTVGTQLYTSGAVSAAYPDAQDIALLATNIRTTPGYYLVRLKFSNGCDSDITTDLIINSQNQFTYTGLQASNNGVLVPLTSGAYNVFNCNTIGLTPTSTNAVQYRFSIQSSNATGGVVTGTGTVNYVEPWLNGPFPPTYDLGTVNGNYLKTHTGYFLLTVEQKDNCNPVQPRSALLNVSSLSAASADYLFNYGDGTTIDPDLTTLASPAQVGQLALGVNAKSSTGYLESYTMKIEKMNQSNGAVIQTVCNYPAGTAVPGNTGTNLPGSIGLNGYTATKCGQVSAYFTQAANQNQVYKLSLTVKNVCGTSVAKVGYFQNSDPNWRKGDAEETVDIQETLASQGHAMYPNPSTGKATLQYVLENETNVSLSITDAQGNKMATVLDNVSKSTGTYTQAIDLANMPDGIYYYRLNTDKAIVGKIVKTSK